MITIHNNANDPNILNRKLIGMIEVFDDLYDAVLFLETQAEESLHEEGFKGELFRTSDGRWRVGINFTNQLEMGL